MDNGSRPRCPHCGFTVFTRLYPACEGCGRKLPVGLAFSDQERQREIERLRSDAERLMKSRDRIREKTVTHQFGPTARIPERDWLIELNRSTAMLGEALDFLRSLKS